MPRKYERKKENLIHFSIRVEKNTLKDLKALAQELGREYTALARELIAKSVESKLKRVKND